MDSKIRGSFVTHMADDLSISQPHRTEILFSQESVNLNKKVLYIIGKNVQMGMHLESIVLSEIYQAQDPIYMEGEVN